MACRQQIFRRSKGAAMASELLIVNGQIVTGDGSTVYDTGYVRVRGHQVVEVAAGSPNTSVDAIVINAAGCTVIPGVINAHAHGCIIGPSMPSGSKPIAAIDVEYFRNRHLLSGTTTLLNVCGLALPNEIDGDRLSRHPLDIHVTTAHTPSNLRAAMEIDGEGLGERHLMATIGGMIDAGAKALGEAGGGQTLGGGAQDYRFIPEAVLTATGVRLPPRWARRLKEAMLGRALDGDGAAPAEVIEEMIAECGLGSTIEPNKLVQLIRKTVMPPVALSLKGLTEIAASCERFGLPGIFHHALPTARTLIGLADRHPSARIVAAHANHPSFEPEECISYARELKKRGVVIDVSTLDCIITRWRNDPANIDLLVSEGLVDTLSTDFAGGDFDSILAAVHRMVQRRHLTLARAVALSTGNVARVFPELAGDRGLLAPEKRADIAVVESHNLARVRHLIVNGRLTVQNGIAKEAAFQEGAHQR